MVIRVDLLGHAYIAVPQAARSLVKSALAAIDPRHGGTDAAGFDQKQVHRVYPTQGLRMHLWDNVRHHFGFTVLRDPLKRRLAVYTNRVVPLGALRNSRNIRLGRVKLASDPDPDHFFQNLAAYTAASSSLKHHALPTVVVTGADLGRYSRVYRTCDIPAPQGDLRDLVGADVTVPHFNATGTPLTLDDLKPATHRALAERLDHEYRHLEDYFANPFGPRR